MKLYDAACMNETFRLCIPNLVDDLIENQEVAREKLRAQARDQTDSRCASALRVLAKLSEKGNIHILKQIQDGMRMGARIVVDEPVEATVFQVVESGRWVTKYGARSTYDLVVVLPEWSKVVSISTSEIEIPTDPMIPRFAKVKLENVHLYSFFNRAHAVRGRRISEVQGTQNNTFDLHSFKPFIRTCKDIENIGQGIALPFFTPLSTLEGLRLGFFFALMCRVTSVEFIRSPTGFGVTLGQSGLTLSDSTGALKARLNTDVFNESVANPMVGNKATLKDPKDLLGVDGNVFVVGVWFLGRSYPEIAHLSLPKDSFTLDTWGVLSFMNSHRKAKISQVSQLFGIESVNEASKKTRCIQTSGDWLYYKNESWPKEIFLAIEKNGFSWNLAFSDALEFGADYADFRVWSKQILPFFRMNPHLLDLYRSKTPIISFEKTQKFPEKEKEAIQEIALEIQPHPWPALLACFTSTNRIKISIVSHRLSSLGYSAWDLFSSAWDNGGYALERRWRRALSRTRKWVRASASKRNKKPVVDEITSALTFIISMRGAVNLPSEALREGAH